MGRLVGLVFALYVASRAEQLPVRAYTTADGLARNQVEGLAQDSRGFLWFCTREGLSRFDGQRFTNFTTAHGLPSDMIESFLEARDGTYWVGTYDGLSRLKPGNGTPRFEVYRPVSSDTPRTFTTLLQDRAGTVWAGTTGGLYRADVQTNGSVDFHRVELPSHDLQLGAGITSIAEDSSGGLWMAGRADGLYHRRLDGRVRRYQQGGWLPLHDVLTVHIDRKGRLWVGTFKGLVQMRLDGDTAIEERNYHNDSGPLGNWIDSIAEGPDGAIWVSAGGRGLVRLLPGSGQADDIITYLAVEGRPNVRGELRFDRDGNLWIATGLEGVLKVGAGGLVTYRESDGMPARFSISQFLESQAGELCGITRETLSNNSNRLLVGRLDSSPFRFSPLHTPPRVRNMGWGWEQIFLQARDREWWVATAEGLCRYPAARSIAELARLKPKAFYTKRDGLRRNEIFRVWEDSRGDVWFGPDLARWERATGRFSPDARNQCLADRVRRRSPWKRLGGA